MKICKNRTLADLHMDFLKAAREITFEKRDIKKGWFV